MASKNLFKSGNLNRLIETFDLIKYKFGVDVCSRNSSFIGIENIALTK